MTNIAFNVEQVRLQFPSLSRTIGDHQAIYFDGPAGTQVPSSVVDLISDCMLHHNANRSGRFATSREVDAIMEQCQHVLGDFVGSPAPESIAFGPNMTSLTLQFSRALSKEWKPGDEAYHPLILTALKDTDPHVQRAAMELLIDHPEMASVEATLSVLHSAPPTDTHLIYTSRLCLRNLLRHNDLMKEVNSKKWSDDDAAFIAQNPRQ